MNSTQLIDEWRKRLPEGSITLGFLVLTLILFSRFAVWAESREGVVLSDPILNVLPTADLTWVIFSIIYVSLLGTILLLLRQPSQLLLFLRAYTIMVLIRMVALYVTPLNPPDGMILLVDPVAALGPGGRLTRDLFFSGHTATACILFLVVKNVVYKRILLVGAIALGTMLLVQHVHYTIDVIAAPFFAYASYRLAQSIRKD